jgi:hypothetical protein
MRSRGRVEVPRVAENGRATDASWPRSLRRSTPISLPSDGRFKTSSGAVGHERQPADEDRAPANSKRSSSQASRAFSSSLVLQFLLGLPEINRHLGVQPKLRRGLQHLCQKKRGLRGDGSSPIDDSVDELNVHAHLLGKRELGQLQRLLSHSSNRISPGDVGARCVGNLMALLVSVVVGVQGSTPPRPPWPQTPRDGPLNKYQPMGGRPSDRVVPRVRRRARATRQGATPGRRTTSRASGRTS